MIKKLMHAGDEHTTEQREQILRDTIAWAKANGLEPAWIPVPGVFIDLGTREIHFPQAISDQVVGGFPSLILVRKVAISQWQSPGVDYDTATLCVFRTVPLLIDPPESICV